MQNCIIFLVKWKSKAVSLLPASIDNIFTTEDNSIGILIAGTACTNVFFACVTAFF
jgi:hypothetical protein